MSAVSVGRLKYPFMTWDTGLVGWIHSSAGFGRGWMDWRSGHTKHYDPPCWHRHSTLKLYERLSLAVPVTWPALTWSRTVCSHSIFHIMCAATECLWHTYRHYFMWQLSVATYSLSVYRINLSTHPTAHTCSAVEAGSNKRQLSDKIPTLYIRTPSATDLLHTHTQLPGDPTATFNTSVTPSHLSPLCFPRIKVKRSFLMFLRLANNCLLSLILSLKLYKFSGISDSQRGGFEDYCFLYVRLSR